jgi:hypothetical protein
MPYLIEPILSLNEINTIAGVQGAGKTRLLFQMIRCILDKQPFFGYRCISLKGKFPIAYCAYDRSAAKTGELLDKFGLRNRIEWKSFRNLKSMESPEPYPLEDLPTKHFPDSHLIIVDGSGLLIPRGKGNDYGHTGAFYRYAGGIAEDNGRTFMFSQHAPKCMADAKIVNARQVNLGSTVTGAMAEGMIKIDFVDHANLEDPRRTIDFMPHDDRPRKILVQFNKDGWFEELDMESITKVKTAWFVALPDMDFTRQIALEIGDKYQLAERTVDKYLKECIDDAMLSHVDRGPYKKIRPA